ncbi:MAG TPA: RES family NAD+ phosphorylase [Gemmatimonadaceae bacterium]|nr:RES family NAD+ phosphorylase [Gemmatimonadaceae bacterium]
MAEFVPPVKRVTWKPSYRIIPSRFPPIQLFERVADPADLEAVFAVEALTNTRIREEVGELQLVAPEDRVSGAGSSWIMAPFTHVSAPGGRFSTPEFGAYYTSRDLATAIAETRYHRARFMAYTSEPPMEIDMRVLRANLSGKLHDIRGLERAHPELYDKLDYSASQVLATRLRAAGSCGIVYDSARHTGGECSAVLRPPVLTRCRQAQHLAYVWDGTSITDVYEKRQLKF